MERETTPLPIEDRPSSSVDDRREFLRRCGQFAAITPPAVTLLLSTTLTSDAFAQSSDGQITTNLLQQIKNDRRQKKKK